MSLLISWRSRYYDGESDREVRKPVNDTHQLLAAQHLHPSSDEDHLSAICRGQHGVVPQIDQRDSTAYGMNLVP